MRIQIGKYIIKNCDERNITIAEIHPAGEILQGGKNAGKVREKDFEFTIGYYPNLEWALHKIKDLMISESDAETVDVLLAELEQIDETIHKISKEIE